MKLTLLSIIIAFLFWGCHSDKLNIQEVYDVCLKMDDFKNPLHSILLKSSENIEMEEALSNSLMYEFDEYGNLEMNVSGAFTVLEYVKMSRNFNLARIMWVTRSYNEEANELDQECSNSCNFLYFSHNSKYLIDFYNEGARLSEPPVGICIREPDSNWKIKKVVLCDLNFKTVMFFSGLEEEEKSCYKSDVITFKSNDIQWESLDIESLLKQNKGNTSISYIKQDEGRLLRLLNSKFSFYSEI